MADNAIPGIYKDRTGVVFDQCIFFSSSARSSVYAFSPDGNEKKNGLVVDVDPPGSLLLFDAGWRIGDRWLRRCFFCGFGWPRIEGWPDWEPSRFMGIDTGY